MNKVLFLLIILSIVIGCEHNPGDSSEESIIQDNVNKNKVVAKDNVKQGDKMTEENFIETGTGLKYIDIKVGDGASPSIGQKVTVHYTGKLANGKKFDSSLDRNRPFSFVIGVGQVIKGWDEGVMSMKVGGKRKLIIPSDLGYGARGAGNVIPPNSELHFEVELLDVK